MTRRPAPPQAAPPPAAPHMDTHTYTLPTCYKVTGGAAGYKLSGLYTLVEGGGRVWRGKGKGTRLVRMAAGYWVVGDKGNGVVLRSSTKAGSKNPHEMPAWCVGVRKTKGEAPAEAAEDGGGVQRWVLDSTVKVELKGAAPILQIFAPYLHGPRLAGKQYETEGFYSEAGSDGASSDLSYAYSSNHSDNSNASWGAADDAAAGKAGQARRQGKKRIRAKVDRRGGARERLRRGRERRALHEDAPDGDVLEGWCAREDAEEEEEVEEADPAQELQLLPARPAPRRLQSPPQPARWDHAARRRFLQRPHSYAATHQVRSRYRDAPAPQAPLTDAAPRAAPPPLDPTRQRRANGRLNRYQLRGMHGFDALRKVKEENDARDRAITERLMLEDPTYVPGPTPPTLNLAAVSAHVTPDVVKQYETYPNVLGYTSSWGEHEPDLLSPQKPKSPVGVAAAVGRGVRVQVPDGGEKAPPSPASTPASSGSAPSATATDPATRGGTIGGDSPLPVAEDALPAGQKVGGVMAALAKKAPPVPGEGGEGAVGSRMFQAVSMRKLLAKKVSKRLHEKRVPRVQRRAHARGEFIHEYFRVDKNVYLARRELNKLFAVCVGRSAPMATEAQFADLCRDVGCSQEHGIDTDGLVKLYTEHPGTALYGALMEHWWVVKCRISEKLLAVSPVTAQEQALQGDGARRSPCPPPPLFTKRLQQKALRQVMNAVKSKQAMRRGGRLCPMARKRSELTLDQRFDLLAKPRTHEHEDLAGKGYVPKAPLPPSRTAEMVERLSKGGRGGEASPRGRRDYRDVYEERWKADEEKKRLLLPPEVIDASVARLMGREGEEDAASAAGSPRKGPPAAPAAAASPQSPAAISDLVQRLHGVDVQEHRRQCLLRKYPVDGNPWLGAEAE